jgi:antitoxin component YwqK of YwqJK toxin-antitoxin module
VFALNFLVTSAQAPGTVFPTGTFGVDYNAFNSKNKREGQWIRVYKSNPKVMYYRGAFLNGVPIGVFEFYNEKGYLKSTVNHIQDTTINDVVNYYADGKTVNSNGRYVGKKVGKTWERQKQGLWEFFDADGRLIRFENYKDNLLNGESKVFYANGQISHEMMYANDEMNGPFSEYTLEGKLSKKGSYKNGIYDGNIVVNYLKKLSQKSEYLLSNEDDLKANDPERLNKYADMIEENTQKLRKNLNTAHNEAINVTVAPLRFNILMSLTLNAFLLTLIWYLLIL